MGDNHGTSIQAGVIHGSVNVYSSTAGPVPGWVDTALQVHQCDEGELGVHNSPPGAGGEGLPPYVTRDVDNELDQRLAAVAAAPRGGMVLVAGASTAGKTRSLAAALGRTLPDRMLVAPPEDADLRPLPGWLKERAGRAPQGWVLWLDDLDRHLGASGLSSALVAELGQAGAVVAVTIRRERLEALSPSTTDHSSASEGAGYTVLKAPPVVLERRWNPEERERALASGDERLVQAAGDERFGVAEQLAAGPLLARTWRNGLEGDHPRGYALVAAAVGLAAAGVSSPLTREQIHTAHGAYLPAPPPLPEEADQAWAWATRPRSGLAGLLVPADHEGLRWRAFDYLTIEGPLPESVRYAALETATVQDRFAVGLAAYKADLAKVAEAAYLPLTDQGHTGAMFGLGVLLTKEGRVEEAETWYRKAAELGHYNAVFNLGCLLANAGRVGEAESWFQRSADLGNIEAVSNLGLLRARAGQLGEAETWYRQAADQRDIGAMRGLAVLLAKAGQLGEAETWYREAAELGHHHTVFKVGMLLKREGRVDQTETWYRKVAELGRHNTVFNVGALLTEVARVGEAESWHRQAADQDHIGTMFNLGILLAHVGRVGEAESWFQWSADLGHISAMANLGVLLTKEGRVEEARDWYRKAADQGHIGAMTNLGLLLEEAGRVEEARAWFRQARME
ncbi:tetratricopeptide repeat protein [Nocardiopsis sp. NPDC055551]